MAKTQDDALNFVKTLIESMGAKIDSIDVAVDPDSEMITISVKSPDSRILIGKDGETLNALSTMLHRYLETGITPDQKPLPLTLDINDFQKGRIDGLKVKAHMMAERAKFFKSSIELEPMNGYERRVIHTYLEKDKNISTESTGTGKERRIVVTYKEE